MNIKGANMNGRTAKILRRLAQRNTKGKPYARYLQRQTTGQIILDPLSCTKGWYRQIKKGLKMRDPFMLKAMEVEKATIEIERLRNVRLSDTSESEVTSGQ